MPELSQGIFFSAKLDDILNILLQRSEFSSDHAANLVRFDYRTLTIVEIVTSGRFANSAMVGFLKIGK